VLCSFVAVAAFSQGCSKKEETAKPKSFKPLPALTAEIRLDKPTATANEELKYTVLIKNNSKKPLAGVKIKFQHPNGVTGEMRQEGGSKPAFDESTKIWTWEVGTINAGDLFWFDFKLVTAPDAPSGATVPVKVDVESTSLSKPVSSNTVTTTIK
jgi:uncharacterized repeat protein (TIGR01451 family)